jgi:carboxyl-terminal processing protease
MACLPETGDDERTLGGTAKDELPGRRFSAGFLAGFLLALLCVLVFFGGYWLAGHTGTSADDGAGVLTDRSTLAKLKTIQTLIERNYLDETDGDTLLEGLFAGVAAGLQDDYARYYSAEEWKKVNESISGAYFGIGATISMDPDDGAMQVKAVYDDSPAADAGLLVGDILKELNGVSLDGVSLADAVSMIQSETGTFTLTVYRESSAQTLTLTMQCGSIALMNYVEYEMKDGQIGYIRLTEFTDQAVEQFHDAACDLQEQGMEALIVDLRNNPGGLLTAVCDILDELLAGQLIVYTEDKNGTREEYYADEEQLITCPVAVLVNASSASAAEIFAGAVQDYALGPIVGTQTYGKGIVQNTFKLTDGSAIKFTVAKYYTPNGQDIHGNGITPDLVVEEAGEASDTDTVLQTAMDALQGSKETEQQEN